MSGAVALSLVPVVVRNKTGGGIEVETAVSALFALGIGTGSLAAAVIARGRIYLKPVPLAALGMAAFLIDLGAATFFLPVAKVEVGLAEFFSSMAGIRIACDVAGLACAGGLFVVPLFTAIQADAPKDRRAENSRRRKHFKFGFHRFGGARDSRAAELARGRDGASASRRARRFEPRRGVLCAQVRDARRGLKAYVQSAKIGTHDIEKGRCFETELPFGDRRLGWKADTLRT